jgi:hypothetical protein
MPIPAEVDGAPAVPGLPGPTRSFTKHRSEGAFGVLAFAVPESRSGSLALKAWTSSTEVLASGLKAVFRLSSHFRSATGAGAGAGAGPDAGAGAGAGAEAGKGNVLPPPPPQPAMMAPALAMA